MSEVAVVIPAYNASATLPETLASVLSQSFDDFEVVIVDDGSTDTTAQVASATGDPRVRVLQTPNGGVAKARNRGIAATRSAYVAFLDADDLWLPKKLERQIESLRAAPDAGFCVTGATRINGESQPIGPMPTWNPSDVGAALLMHSMVVGPLSSGVARREVLARVGGFDERFSQSADWDLWLRLAGATRFEIVSEPLVLYRTAAGNMSSNIDLLERDTFGVLDSFYASPLGKPYEGLRSRVYAAHWLVCAGSYAHVGRTRDAIRCVSRATATHPASVGRPLGLPIRWLRRQLTRTRERT